MRCFVLAALALAASAPLGSTVAMAKADGKPPAETARVLRWIAATHDNGQLPYAVIDKQRARLMLFDAQGKPLGEAPVLIGIAGGDDSAPGVGSKPLAELGPEEKTTPAGRFDARFGFAAGRKEVLWIDYGAAVAIHPVVDTNRQERRLQRLSSAKADDNRITFGCINVPVAFYEKSVEPLFRARGGVVYVLPDTRSLEEIFPALYTERYF